MARAAISLSRTAIIALPCLERIRLFITTRAKSANMKIIINKLFLS